MRFARVIVRLSTIAGVAFSIGLFGGCGSDDTSGGNGSGGSAGDAAADSNPEASIDTGADSPMPGKGTVGAPCIDDSQCGADGSICLKATDAAWVADGNVAAGSGPAGGYCSISCADYFDDKTDVDPCAAFGGHCYLRWCLEGCSFGTDDAGTKCHGRQDVGCMSIATKNGFSPTPGCAPICSPSSDCGAGRACDPQTSRCKDLAYVNTGLPDGAACASTGTAGVPGCSQCAGSSLSVAGIGPDGGDPPRICGTRCISGVGFDCGPMKACMWVPVGKGKGDVGYCTQLCDDVSQCHDTVHEVTCDMSVKAQVGHGYCDVIGPSAPFDGGSDAAADAPAD